MFYRQNAILFSVLLILDQITKVAAYTYLELGVPRPVIDELFNFTLVYNPGAAFGMFSGLSDFWRRTSLFIVSCLALVVVFRFMRNEARDDRISQLALSGILAGAFGNIIDRFRFDAVVDFLDVYWGTYHWPAFNVADSAICVGVTVLVFRMIFFAEPSELEEVSSPEASSEAQS